MLAIGVLTERLSAQTARTAAAILYIHGGAWSSGSPQSHRPITWRLAKQTGVAVYAIDYRLAPEHRYPAQLDDCTRAYDALLEKGVPAQSIVVAGDSAGGNLTLALALRLKSEGKPLPAALVCLSAITDLTSSGRSFKTNETAEAIFPPHVLGVFREIYSPGADYSVPVLSPLFGDVTGLPPTLFQVAATELLLDDSVRMAEKAAGVAATLDVWPGLRQAIERMAAFIAAHVRIA